MSDILTLVERSGGYGIAWFLSDADCYGAYVGETLGHWGPDYTIDGLFKHYIALMKDTSRGVRDPDTAFEEFENGCVDSLAYELVEANPHNFLACRPGEAFIWEDVAKAKEALRALSGTRKKARKLWRAVLEQAESERDYPEWARMALEAGWKPPKGWKP